jgi:biopolymer transport protein ExbD
LASLFLILLLCALPARGPMSVGINVPMTRVREIPSENCFSGLRDRDIVLSIKGDGATWINGTRLKREEVRERMSRIYENRAERIAYLLVDPNVSYGEFADVYDHATSSTPGLHIGLLTRQVREQVDHCPQGRGCTIEWAYAPGNIYCKNMFPPAPAKALRSPGR